MEQPPAFPPGVSVVICTFNGAERIPRVIDHLLKQQGTEDIAWEIVVVDNGSADDTAATAYRSHGGAEVPLTVVEEPRQGVAHARMKGVLTARYEYISFIDDDNFVTPGWVVEVYRLLNGNPVIGMCGGLNEAAFEASPPVWFQSVKGGYAVGAQGDRSGDVTLSRGYLHGAGLSFRKSVFVRLLDAGFCFHTIGRSGRKLSAGEDAELTMGFMAAGYRLWYSDQLKLTHYMPAGRMEWDYARRLFRGLGESEFLLNLYRTALRRDSFPLMKIYGVLAGYAILYFGWRMATPFSNHIGNPRYLSYLARKYYILQALRSMTQARTIYREISTFCARAAMMDKESLL